eukprot:gene17344-22891_t
MRGLREITELINNSNLSNKVKYQSLQAFNELAKAEAKVHGTTIDNVHFHEVGAIDSIIDTVGVFIALELLNIDDIYCSALPLSSGTVWTAHGLLPVPSPATLYLMKDMKVIPGPKGITGELVTPTGATLVRVMCKFAPLELDGDIDSSTFSSNKQGISPIDGLVLRKVGVEGKIKRKSIKSAVTSLSNEKKRISRMGKKNKKGKMGPSADYFTRSAILRKLQITLKDFRRLCILKGIYPRVPEKALKGSDKIYYDVKDIAYLSHEPLLKKFREFKSFMKKIRREAGRNQFTEAKRKNELKPVINLNHLVKERYPRFIDALRDLEDCLCMVHLFASLPSVGRITSETTKICKELCNHWQFYIAKNKLLEKVFVSIKGIYYQVIIMGEPITWLVPHEFTQVIPKEIDIHDNKEGYTPSYKQEIKSIKSSLEVQTISHPTNEEENNYDDSSEDDNDEDSENDEVSDDKVGDKQKVTTNNQIIEELDYNEIEINNNEDIEINEDSDNDDSTVEEAATDYSKKGPKGVVYNPVQPKQSEDEEAKQLSLQMMSKKTKRLYGRMQHGIKKKTDFIETLTKKRKNHEDNEIESKSNNQFVDVKSPKVARLNKIKNKTKK